jgi:UDP-3-O-[3-hydroxymyristoyl] glucosamine N-acyltransferase
MTLVRARSVKEVADFVQASVLGDETVQLSGIASVESAVPGDLIFVDDEKHLPSALESQAAAVIAGDFAAAKTSSKPLLLATQPRLAFAHAAQLICPERERKLGIHPSAIVNPSARLANTVTVEERVVIGEGVQIGGETRIGAGAVIGAKASIGFNCDLYPNVTIYPGVRLGNRVIVHSGAVLGSDGFGYVRDQATGRYEKFPQIGRLEIEDDVEIGANATIDRGALDATRIGRGTKIDNLVHVGHNCRIGEDVVIAAQTGLSGSAVLENGVVVAGQVGIADHVRVEAGAILGAQCGVPSKKVIRGKGVVFWGTPARPIREYLKELALLARLAKKE